MLNPPSMFFHLLFIHLFRPFLKYRQGASALPSHVSPRKLCTRAASGISKLFRLYKRTYGLQQICNITVYICHTACTIHLLNIPDKNASRDFVHGVRHLEAIAESWLGARRTLGMLHVAAKKWNIELPYEAETVLSRTDEKYPHNSHTHRHTPKANSPLAALAQPTNQQSTADQNVTSQGFGPHTFSAPTSASHDAKNPPPSGPLILQDSIPPGAFATQIHAPQNRYELPPEQLALWNRDQAVRKPTTQNATSPHLLFGGIDALVRDDQDFWLREENRLFDQWNAHRNGCYTDGNGNNNSNEVFASQGAFYDNDAYGMSNATTYGSRPNMM